MQRVDGIEVYLNYLQFSNISTDTRLSLKDKMLNDYRFGKVLKETKNELPPFRATLSTFGTPTY